MPSLPPVHIALLRGINVGGRGKLPMKDLRRIFEDAGCRDVTTYIQSGNVVFTAPAAALRKLPATVTRAVNDEFGHQPHVVLRSAADLVKIVRANPYKREAEDPKLVHVAFLDAKPSAARVRKLDPDRSPGDTFVVKGREVYVHYPNGAARTKLTAAYLESMLEARATARNWRTVEKLLELSTARP